MGHPCFFIFTSLEQRQCPKVRRCPHEYDGEKNQWLHRNRTRHRCPANHRRECPSCTANYNVLGRRALEPHGVDDGIEKDCKGQQKTADSQLTSTPIVIPMENIDRCGSESRQRFTGLDFPAWNGSVCGFSPSQGSMSASYHMLSAPDAPAPIEIHNMAINPVVRMI